MTQPSKEASVPACFIVMPISVRKDLVAEYHGGEDHFGHVLRHLFTPAVEKAGFKPISPKAKGSEMIHGEIITNLQTADLVLCDMSTLNANVFMELGIRTSLNKPVCLVKDDKTALVPFDTTVLNHHTYKCTLDPWILEKEVPALSDHILSSAKTCAGANPLWKYFGLTMTARPTEAGTTDDRLALLTSQVEKLNAKIQDSSTSRPPYASRFGSDVADSVDAVVDLAAKIGVSIQQQYSGNNRVILEVDASSPAESARFRDALAHSGIPVVWYGADIFSVPTGQRAGSAPIETIPHVSRKRT